MERNLHQSIGTDETNSVKFVCFYYQNYGGHSFSRFVGARVSVAHCAT